MQDAMQGHARPINCQFKSGLSCSPPAPPFSFLVTAEGALYHYLRHVGRKLHEAVSSEVYAQCRAACVTFAISHRSPNTDQEHYIQQSFDLVRLLNLVVGGWRCLCFAIAGGTLR